jgi:predicted PurR-regulated permease PerM
MPDRLARERSTTLLFYGCVFLLAYVIYLLFRPFLTPLAWAAIFAAFFFPYFKRLEHRYGKTFAASVSTAAVTLIIVVPFVLIVLAFVQQATETMGSIDLSASGSRGLERAQRAWGWLQQQRFGRDLPNLEELIERSTGRAAGLIANSAGAVFRNVAFVIVDLVIMLFALFFFFRDGEAIMRRLRRVLPFDASFRERRIAEAANLIRASLSSGLLVALTQGAVGGLAFLFLGLGAPIFWGVVMAVFSLLPLGAWIVWTPVAIWLLVTGETARGITLLAVGAGVISLIDNFLRPILLSGRTQLNGLLVFISLLGGLAAFGLLGLVLGPIIMATTVSFVDAYATDRSEGNLENDDVQRKSDRPGRA